MTLTKEEQLTIASGGNVAVTIDGIRCVLVRADFFERARRMIAGEMGDDPRLTYASVLRAWDVGADAAEHDLYRDLA